MCSYNDTGHLILYYRNNTQIIELVIQTRFIIMVLALKQPQLNTYILNDHTLTESLNHAIEKRKGSRDTIKNIMDTYERITAPT